MKCNVGKKDKIIRIIVALIAAYFGYTISPWFYLITAIGLVTAAISFCPVSKILGINTCEKE